MADLTSSPPFNAPCLHCHGLNLSLNEQMRDWDPGRYRFGLLGPPTRVNGPAFGVIMGSLAKRCEKEPGSTESAGRGQPWLLREKDPSPARWELRVGDSWVLGPGLESLPVFPQWCVD